MKYIDSSAFVKYYAGERLEKGADEIRNLFEKVWRGEETLITSMVLLGEVISTFDKWHRQHILTEQELQEQLALFVGDIMGLMKEGSLFLEPISPLIFISSLTFITQYHIALGDAIHLYTALMYLPKQEEFICSDQNLNEAARAEGFIVINPEGGQ
jgi:predicted nucleic acid-binding protein